MQDIPLHRPVNSRRAERPPVFKIQWDRETATVLREVLQVGVLLIRCQRALQANRIQTHG